MFIERNSSVSSTNNISPKFLACGMSFQEQGANFSSDDDTNSNITPPMASNQANMPVGDPSGSHGSNSRQQPRSHSSAEQKR